MRYLKQKKFKKKLIYNENHKLWTNFKKPK